jgi:hypothetical protein
MVVSIVPTNGSTIRNGSLVNTGGIYDTGKSLFRQGSWVSGSLDGSSCIKTDYSGNIVNIKTGPYSAGFENGNIIEYDFPKTSWVSFITNPPAGVAATKYAQVYENGILSSTTSTTPVNITGLVTYDAKGHIIDFFYSEV